MSNEEQNEIRDPLVHRVTNLLGFLFSYMGGIGRASYWLGLLIVIVLLLVSLVVLASFMNPTGPGDAGFAVPPLLLSVWIFSALTVKRLRDAGFAGWHYLVFAGGPALMIMVGLELLFWPLMLLGLVLLIAIPGFYSGKPKRT